MSGGLDSTMAAALLLERGFRVEGLTMRLWQEDAAAGEALVAAARAACAALGIRHHTVDMTQRFLQDVVSCFLSEYARGRTPNPCLQCNRLLKFGGLLEWAQREGFDILATGHYARIDRQDGRYRLLAGVDRRKDQSYFLYALGQAQLAQLSFPLGELTKERVRAMARERGLRAAERPESQDVCFILESDYRRFVARRRPEAVVPGPIYSRAGRVLGEHRGLASYTIGQREGLGISAPRPLYVLEIDPPRNALVVGHAEELGHRGLEAEGASYVSGQAPPPGLEVEARIRYRARGHRAQAWPLEGGRLRVTFYEALRDITPGQAVVLYRGDEVLGGGIIDGAVD